MTNREDIDRATELLAAHQYLQAREMFESALEDGESAAAMVGYGMASRALDDVGAAVPALERAYQLHLGDDAFGEAAYVAGQLADIALTHAGRPAVASGWLARARRHLEKVPDHPALVTIEGLQGYLALAYEKDPAVARDHAVRSLAAAERVGDPAAGITARAHLGLTEVSLGNLEEGFGLLDEATAAASAGELDPLTALDTYCLLITAGERVRDFDRVDQWAQQVLSLATLPGSDGFATFARTQFANVLIWRGRWDEADAELDRVLQDAADQPMTAAVGFVLKASLQRRRGELDKAKETLSQAAREPYRSAVRHLVLVAGAGLELARGDAQAAADLAERYLHAVATTDVIERVEALEILVRARLDLAEPDPATAAADELRDIATAIGTPGVRGASSAAAGLVAKQAGDLDVARRMLEQAVTTYEEAGLPYEVASTKIDLADLLRMLGELDASKRTANEARSAALDLGALGCVEAAESVLDGFRDDVAGDSDLTRREVEVLRLMAEGRSNAEIADELVLSVRTVERHVSNIYLKVGATGSSARTVAVAYGRREGIV